MTLQVIISKKLIPYKTAFLFLKKRVELIKKSRNRELVWILEHPLTFTSGIRSTEKEILDKNIKIIKTNRGGKITLHSPGQKIVYFALDLNSRKKDIKNLVKKIELSIIEFLKLAKLFDNLTGERNYMNQILETVKSLDTEKVNEENKIAA